MPLEIELADDADERTPARRLPVRDIPVTKSTFLRVLELVWADSVAREREADVGNQLDDATEATKLDRQYIEALAAEIRPLVVAETAANIRAEQDRYPLTCPRCGGPAYHGLNVIDCAKGCE